MRVKAGQGEESRETKPPGIRVDDRATESDSNCIQANQDQFFSRAARQAGNKDVKSDEEEIARGVDATADLESVNCALLR